MNTCLVRESTQATGKSQGISELKGKEKEEDAEELDQFIAVGFVLNVRKTLCPKSLLINCICVVRG